MEDSAQITNGMLYEMIRAIRGDLDLFGRELASLKQEVRDFKEDFRSFKSDITARQTEDHQMLMELWKERGRIEVKFSKLMFLAVAALSFIVALTVSVIVVTVGG